MKIAELFSEIVLKGAQNASKDLGLVFKGFKEAESSALLTKAAIAGVVIGLERLTGFASQAGMDLNKFALVTGLSTDELQRWQYVARTYDVTAEEMASTVRGLQSTITDMMLGKGMPEGAAALGIKMTRDPFNLMKQLAHAAKTLPPDIAGALIKSFGISDNVFQMLRASNLELDQMSKKDIISTGEIQRLTLINKLWKDFWFTLRTMGIKAVAKEGVGAVMELKAALKGLLEAEAWVERLVKKFDSLKVILPAIGIAIALAFAPLSTVVTGLGILVAEFQKFREGKDNVFSAAAKMGASSETNIKEAYQKGGIGEVLGSHKMDIAKSFIGEGGVPGLIMKNSTWAKSAMDWIGSAFDTKPAAKGVAGAGGAPSIEIHNHGVEHPKETAEETRKGISDAYRQLSAQMGGQ